jgi:general stress protein 26
MNVRRFTLTVFASAVLICCAASASRLSAQQSQFSRNQLITAAREIMTTTRYCALITTDSHGRANTRAMDAFAPDENMIVWFATNPLSRKVSEIRRHPRVTLYYFDRENQAYVTLHGVARLVNDKREKARRWKDDWKVFLDFADKHLR